MNQNKNNGSEVEQDDRGQVIDLQFRVTREGAGEFLRAAVKALREDPGATPAVFDMAHMALRAIHTVNVGPAPVPAAKPEVRRGGPDDPLKKLVVRCPKPGCGAETSATELREAYYSEFHKGTVTKLRCACGENLFIRVGAGPGQRALEGIDGVAILPAPGFETRDPAVGEGTPPNTGN